MKRLILALVLSLLAGTPAFAKDFSIKACTLDKQEATVVLDIADDTPEEAKDGIAASFTTAAAALSFEDLNGEDGFYQFIGGLTPDEFGYINEVISAPKVTGTCDE